MSKLKQSLPEDIDITVVDEPFYYGDEETKKDTRTAGQKLIDAIEEEKASREWELSKYLDSEIRDEYKRRFPF